MDWFAQVDAYCERVDFTFWSEPLNAITNLAFVIAAIVVARRASTAPAKWLCAILFMIGIGSFLFHTFATRWAELADVLPIGVFILAYLFLANRDLAGMRWFWAVGATALFVPYAAALVPVFNAIPFIEISNFYWTVPLLLLGYAAWLRIPGLAIGAAILVVSITVRSFDMIWCVQWPIGTHFAWHTLNAIMLGYVILVYDRHALAGQGRRG